MKAISQDFTFQEESSIPTNIFFFLAAFSFYLLVHLLELHIATSTDAEELR